MGNNHVLHDLYSIENYVHVYKTLFNGKSVSQGKVILIASKSINSLTRCS